MNRRYEKRQTFVFHEAWIEVIDELPDDDQLKIYDTIVHYALYTVQEPVFKEQMVSLVWKVIKRDIDADFVAYMNKCEKLRANGSKGGKTKAENQLLANATNCNQSLAIAPDNDYDNEYDNDNDCECECEYTHTPKKTIVSIPCINGMRAEYTEDDIAELRIKFTRINVTNAINNVKDYLTLNPEKQKDVQNTRAYVVRWLTKDNENSTGTQPKVNSNDGASYDIAEFVRQNNLRVPTVKKRERR